MYLWTQNDLAVLCYPPYSLSWQEIPLGALSYGESHQQSAPTVPPALAALGVERERFGQRDLVLIFQREQWCGPR